MKLVAKYDLEAPAAFVFGQMADFDGWERMAMRRGVEVMRTDKLAAAGAGMSWDTHFRYRGKQRNAMIRLDTFAPPGSMTISAAAKLFDGVAKVDVVSLTPKRTRIEVRLEVLPKTLTARIYLQSLRLARARVERSFSNRVAQLAAEIEGRFRVAVV